MNLFESKKRACGHNYKNESLERRSEHEHEPERESKSQVETREKKGVTSADCSSQRSRTIEKTDTS
jgi:hypothetical protein